MIYKVCEKPVYNWTNYNIYPKEIPINSICYIINNKYVEDKIENFITKRYVSENNNNYFIEVILKDKKFTKIGDNPRDGYISVYTIITKNNEEIQFNESEYYFKLV